MQIDMTRPNPARTIDYMLGGIHHFEIDRQWGDQLVRTTPFLVELQRQSRQVLQRVVRYYTQECGLRTLVDFGAGLPTCMNTHLVARGIDQGIRVLYNDIDALTVAYGHEILANDPNVLFIQGDATNPIPILEQPDSQEFLRGDRRVGILYMGLGHLMSDEQLRSAALALYDWAAPGSRWFLTHGPPEWHTDPQMKGSTETLRAAGITVYLRTPQQLVEVLAPWKLPPEGVTFNLQWGLPSPDPSPPPPLYSFEVMMVRE